MLFHGVVGKTLRGEIQDAKKVLVRAPLRCHGRRTLCRCRLRIALKNGDNALPMERQDDPNIVLLLKKLDLIFTVKTRAELQHCLDTVGIMLRHDAGPVVKYHTRTVELPSLLEACPTFLQAAMNCV